jgi:hypothetical protein
MPVAPTSVGDGLVGGVADDLEEVRAGVDLGVTSAVR